MTRKLILAAALAASVLSGGVAIPALAQQPDRPMGRDDGPPPSGQNRAFAKVDKNRDGIVSRQEYVAAATRKFDKLDRNRDGRLTPDEMTKGDRRGGRRGMRGGNDMPPPQQRDYQ